MDRQRGQALLFVLLLLALGALMITPALQAIGYALKASPMYTSFTNEDYAADAALDYGLWRLNYEPGYASNLPLGVPSPPFYITINGITANATVTPQASGNGSLEQLSGQQLMSVNGTPIYYKVTKTVTPNSANVNSTTNFTYTISIKSYDPTTNTTHKLTNIRDILSYQFSPDASPAEGYINNSTTWNATSWGISPFNPDIHNENSNNYEWWHLDWNFGGGIPFEYGETKTMSFRVTGRLVQGYWGNDVDVTPGGDFRPFQAPIRVGNPTGNVPFSYVSINKTIDTEILYPNIAANVTYTVNATNVDTVPISINRILDWLPSTGFADPAFVYIGNSTTAFITRTNNSTVNISMPDSYNGSGNILTKTWRGSPYMRWELAWDFTQHADARFDPVILAVGEKLTVTFRATVTPRASGIYLNEFNIDCTRYPATVNVTASPTLPANPPSSNTTYTITVNMTNPDAMYFTEYNRLKAWLPSTDTGNQSQAFTFNSSYTPTYVIRGINNNILASGSADNPSSTWDTKKKRWLLTWDVDGGWASDLHLNTGESAIFTFKIKVSPSNPSLNVNELVWRIDFKTLNDINQNRSIYSFPTAGVMVPMYDLTIQTLSSILKANAWLGSLSTIHTKSEHWEEHR